MVAFLPEQSAVRRRIPGRVVVVVGPVPGIARHHHVPAGIHRDRPGGVGAAAGPVVALLPEQRAIRRRILGSVVIGVTDRGAVVGRPRHHDIAGGVERYSDRTATTLAFTPEQRAVRRRILGRVVILHSIVTLLPRHHHVAAAAHLHSPCLRTPYPATF